MFEYVLVLYLKMNQPEYAGHFKDCATANQYAAQKCPKCEYTSCLHEDYIKLPKGLIIKNIDLQFDKK